MIADALKKNMCEFWRLSTCDSWACEIGKAGLSKLSIVFLQSDFANYDNQKDNDQAMTPLLLR